MRTTVEIQDVLFRRIKSAAAVRGVTLKRFLHSAIARELERIEHLEASSKRTVQFPLVPSKKPGAKVPLTNERISEILDEEDIDALA